MEEHWGCGSSVAKLSNRLGKTIGWVIRWENAELSILWLGNDCNPDSIEPALTREMLGAAANARATEMIKLLDSLSTKERTGR